MIRSLLDEHIAGGEPPAVDEQARVPFGQPPGYHVAGDECLRTVARALAANARRAGELAARKMLATKSVVEVLPLVPVTPTSFSTLVGSP